VTRVAVSRDPAFRTVRMRESYDLDAVDDFVDLVIDALEGKASGRSLTPEKIEAQEFKVVRLREGYSMDDVDDWLDEAAAELRRFRSAPAHRPAEPAHQEPSYEQVGAANHGYGGPPPQQVAPPQPAAPPVAAPPVAAAPVAPSPPVAYPLPEQPQQYHQDTGYVGTDHGSSGPGPDTAFHQLDPALRALDPSYGGGADQGYPASDPGFGSPESGYATDAGFSTDTGYGQDYPSDASFPQPTPPAHNEAIRPANQVSTPTTGLHHMEIWVRDLEAGLHSFGWLFERLGWTLFQVWDNGRSWQAPGDGPYVVVERSPDISWTSYDRKAPGLNHLALAVPERWMVDRVVSEASTFGWRLLFSEQHPFAGGPQHYAAYLENDEGFEVEVVAP
jgi:DivIVA domain-containing protein